MINETVQVTTQPETAAQPAAPVHETKTVHRVQPQVDIVEKQDAYEIVADVPGVTREDITLRIEADTLLLSARSGGGHPKVRKPWQQLEYTRSFRLGRQIDREHIDAQLAHGVLRITLGKVQAAQPREIPVHTTEAAQN